MNVKNFTRSDSGVRSGDDPSPGDSHEDSGARVQRWLDYPAAPRPPLAINGVPIDLVAGGPRCEHRRIPAWGGRHGGHSRSHELDISGRQTRAELHDGSAIT